MEDTFLGYRFLLLAFIVAVTGFFASAEMALVSVRQSRLRAMAEEGVVGAQAALSLLSHPERLFSTIQVGTTLAGLGAGWAGEDTVYLWLTSILPVPSSPAGVTAMRAGSFVIAFLLLTYFMVVFGEVVPKNVGIKNAERMATMVAPLVLVFYRVTEPFVFVLERSASAISRLLGLGVGEISHSVEELKLMAASVRASGRISEFEEDMLERALELRNISVRQVMVPRNDVVSLPLNASLEQVLRTMIEHQHARVPVYDEHPEHIVGILYYKDLWPALETLRAAGNRPFAPRFRLRLLIRKHLVVPETKPLDQMLQDFIRSHTHMAMVVDEFGTIVGLLTLEDVMEQVFGEIEDEHDVDGAPPALESPMLELEGTISIRDLITRHEIELPENAGFETLAGFLLFRLGHIPQPGETVEYDGRRFTILEMENRRIAKVRIEKLGAEASA